MASICTKVCNFIFFLTALISPLKIFLGINEKRDGMSATLFPVHKLTLNDCYHDVCHICHTDNWYTSVESCVLCRQRKILAIGTVKINRKGLPKAGIFPKTGGGKQVKGVVKCMQRVGEDLYFTAWQDNKPVHMLSTIKPRLQKIMRKSSTLGWRRAEINSHSLIPAYNFGMGGTDRMDQLNSYYSFHHKGIRWTHRIFTHFLGVSVVNANILYNLSFTKNRMSSVQFFNAVILSLADLGNEQFFDDIEVCKTAHGSLEPLVRRPPVVPVEAAVLAPSKADETKVPALGYQRYRSSNLEKKNERLDGMHVPIMVSNAKRRKCVFHPKTKTRYECETCQVPLCLSEGGKESCWAKFHYEEQWGEK